MPLKRIRERFSDGAKRKVLLTEVTRMSGGQVCTAGIDIYSNKMIRPLQPGGNNWPENKWVDEGYLVVGNVISLKSANEESSIFPHASEDFRVARVGLEGKVSVRELYDACVETSDKNIESIFGENLIDGKFVTDGAECRSLGSIEVPARRLNVKEYYDKVQVSYRDISGKWYNLTVTELLTKNYGDANSGVRALSDRLVNAGSKSVILRLGLTRPWSGANQEYNPRRCIMQLNGIITPE